MSQIINLQHLGKTNLLVEWNDKYHVFSFPSAIKAVLVPNSRGDYSMFIKMERTMSVKTHGRNAIEPLHGS
jgi:hypothetical protein